MTFDKGSGAQFNKQMIHLFWRLQQHALGTYTNTTSFVLGETNAVFFLGCVLTVAAANQNRKRFWMILQLCCSFGFWVCYKSRCVFQHFVFLLTQR